MHASAGVAVVIVNFNSGEYLGACLESLAPGQQSGVEADVIVIDNASPKDQSQHLAAARDRGARILALDRNHGYAGGCNRGLAATHAPIVCFLNADVVAGVDSIPILATHLQNHDRIGFAEPRCYIDPARQWRQPAFRLPTPGRLLAEAIANFSAAAARLRRRRELQHQLVGWQATSPVACEALSGAFLAGRREVILRLGGFDEAFPLGYEDTDIFRRMHSARLTLALVPAAEAVHFAHRSRITALEESLTKDRLGRAAYLRRHHGRTGLLLDRLRERTLRRPAAAAAASSVLQLGTLDHPAALTLRGRPGPFVAQIAYDPSFQVAAGRLGNGSMLEFAPASWAALIPTQVHVRAFGLPHLEQRGAWTFRLANAATRTARAPD